MEYLRRKFHGDRRLWKVRKFKKNFARKLYDNQIIINSFSFVFLSDSLTLLGGDIILNRKIFSRNTTVPTNYTIVYKYIRAELSGLISFIEFECIDCVCIICFVLLTSHQLISLQFSFLLQNITGIISHETGIGLRKETVVSSTLNIFNGTNVAVWIRIFGFGASMSSRIFTDPFTVEIFGDKLFEPKSFALVYAHNTTQTRYNSIHLGERQPGDHLLKFDSKFIQRTSTTNFPESEFEYGQTNAYLTHIFFSFNVSIYLSILSISTIYLFIYTKNNFGPFTSVANCHTFCE